MSTKVYSSLSRDIEIRISIEVTVMLLNGIKSADVLRVHFENIVNEISNPFLSLCRCVLIEEELMFFYTSAGK